MNETLDDYEQLPEEYIRSMAATSGPGNNFHKLVEMADAWIAADLTPAFIVTGDSGNRAMIACVCKESFGRYFN